MGLTVKYELTEGEKCKRSLRIEVPLERVQNKFDQIYRKLKAEANIPGFRPGRVPMATVRSRFGDLAKADALDELLQESYREVLDESKLEPVGRPTIRDVEFAEDKALVYVAELEIRPEIKLMQYKGLNLKRPDDRVKEGEIKNFIEYLQRKHGELNAVNRQVREGDFVYLDLEILSDSGGKLKQKEFKNVRIELRSTGVTRQFLDHLVGLSAGAEKEFDIVYPSNHFDHEFAGSTIRFRAKLNEAKELILPALDREFFKQRGFEAQSEEEFREEVKGVLQRQKMKESDDELRDNLIKTVIDKNRFDLPETMLENYLSFMIEDIRKNSQEPVDEAEIRDRYRAYGIRTIRWDLLQSEIAKAEGIKVEQADIDIWVQRFADNHKMTAEEAKQRIAAQKQVSDLKDTILEQKVIDFILSCSSVEKIESPLLEPQEEQR